MDGHDGFIIGPGVLYVDVGIRLPFWENPVAPHKVDRISCLFCGKALIPAYDKTKDVSPEDNSWSKGVVGSVSGGYGSTHDGVEFILGICDGCIDLLIKRGKLKVHKSEKN